MDKLTYRKQKPGKKEHWTGWAFIALPIIGFTMFTALSMLVSVFYSFTDFNPVRDEITKFTFQNYERIFTDEEFWNACLNTVIFLVTIPLGMC